MKKLTTLLLCLVFASLAFAKPVTKQIANQVANNYFAAYSSRANASVASSFSKSYNDITTYYVFNFAGGGFVVVSADDAATPVLAYSKEGYVETEITNPSTQFWFDCYSKEIAQAVADRADNSAYISEWGQILNNEIDAPMHDVSPLLATLWDQGQWYNYSCPATATGPGGKAITGCVATAMGQIMKFHNFPSTGVGSHSYKPFNFEQQTANFGATDYNFASMSSTASSSSYAAVATLLYHAGVSVDMDYGATVSNANMAVVPWTMSNYFNYDNKSIGIAYKANYTTANWKTLLMAELDANRPVLYAGNTSSAGHAWVCDGYQNSDGKFHMNWGWSGVSNGYFAIGALSTGNGAFNFNNQIVYGIRPGNNNLIVRFTDLQEYTKVLTGTQVDINCSVSKGAPSSVNLYIDSVLVFNTSETMFTYTWNTGTATLGLHTLRVEALNATDTVYHQVKIDINEWKTQSSGFNTQYRMVQCISAVDSLVVWANASDGQGLNAIAEFTKTTDGGETWTAGQVVGGNNYLLTNICALNANVAYVSMVAKTVQDNNCGVYKTSDGGATWTHLVGALQGPNSFSDNVWFWNENEGMCNGDVKDNYFEIYTTSNGGTTWTRVPKANIGNGANPVTGEGCWGMVIQAVGDSTIMFGTTKGNFYVSHDRGHNWSISNIGISPITQGITLLSFKDRYNGLVAQTVGTVVLRETHDGGASWQTVTPTGPFRSGTLCYVPGTENTFVSANYRSIGAAGASYSFDGGHSWSQFPGTEDQVYTYCQFVNNHCGWSGSIVTSANADGMYKFVGTLDPSTMFRPVMDLSAQTQINTVHLSWNQPITNPIEYKIYKNDTLILTTNSLQYDDLQVANGQQNYCVVAVYDIGESIKSCATAWITVGINNPEDLAYKVYPNPSNGILNIETPFTFKEIRLLNSLGQVVYRNTVSGKNLQILTEGFDPGMYFLQVYTENKVVTSKVAISR